MPEIKRLFQSTEGLTRVIEIDPGPGRVLVTRVLVELGGGGGGGHAYAWAPTAGPGGGTGGGGGGYSRREFVTATSTAIALFAGDIALGQEGFLNTSNNVYIQNIRTGVRLRAVQDFINAQINAPGSTIPADQTARIAGFDAAIARIREIRSGWDQQFVSIIEFLSGDTLQAPRFARLGRTLDTYIAQVQEARAIQERRDAILAILRDIVSETLELVMQMIRDGVRSPQYRICVGIGGPGGINGGPGEQGGASFFYRRGSELTALCSASGGGTPTGGGAVPGPLNAGPITQGGNGNPPTTTVGTPSTPTEGSINVASVRCSGGGGSGAYRSNAIDAGLPGGAKWPGGAKYNDNGTPYNGNSMVAAGGNGQTEASYPSNVMPIQSALGGGGGGGAGGYIPLSGDTSTYNNGQNGAPGSILITMNFEDQYAGQGLPGRPITGRISQPN